MSVKRFGVSLDNDVLRSLDELVADNQFSNRSQALRFLVEKHISEQKWLCNHIVAGAIVLMFDQHDKEIMSRITTIESTYHAYVLSSTQHYLDDNFCLHIATVKGPAYALTGLSDKLIAIKGLRHGKLVMSRAD
ncbi:MAG: ribbon-helix-helix protein, CopG family [Bacteroidales bacterium]